MSKYVNSFIPVKPFLNLVRGLIVVLGAMIVQTATVAADRDELPRYITFDSMAGPRCYSPERWSMLSVGIVNPADRPVETLSSLYFQDHSEIQYARRLWVPARAKRMSWCPVLIPRLASSSETTPSVRAILYSKKQDEYRLIESPGGQRFHEGLLRVEHKRPITGCILDDDKTEVPRKLLKAVRAARNLPIRLSGLQMGDLPPRVETMEVLDQLVLANDRVRDDAAAMTSIRQWLHGGGKLWIMLDHVRPETVSRLLGDSFRCHVVDRVEMTELQILCTDRTRGDSDGEHLRFEDPVDLVRVVGVDMEVDYTVDGWPAAFWQKAGRGEVLFTTVGGRAWMRNWPYEERIKVGILKRSEYAATAPMQSLAYRFLSPRSTQSFKPELFRGLAMQQISYRIIGRSWIFLVLGVFCLVVLGAGLWLARARRMTQLGWLGPALAVLAAVVVSGMGYSTKRGIPPTVVETQLLRLDSGIDDVSVDGLVAVYNDQQTSFLLGADRGGILTPDWRGLAGQTRQMTWTDIDKWHWADLSLPQGVRLASTRYSTQFSPRIEAQASWNAEGLVGRLAAGPFTRFADAVIAGRGRGVLAVQLSEDKAFTAATTLASGEFVASGLLNDMQQRRQEVYRQLVRSDDDGRFPERTTLMVWAKSLDAGFQFDPRAQRVGDALLIIPLQMESPEAGTKVRVPTPLLPYRAIPIPGTKAISSSYDNKRRKWIGPLVKGTNTLLRFELPPELLPMRVDRAVMTVRIDATKRRLDLLGLLEDQPQVLETQNSPVGVVQFTVDRQDVLAVDADGGVILGLAVGEFQGEKTGFIQDEGWTIEDASLELFGEVLAE